MRINYKYLLIFFILFIAEVLIAIYLKEGFIRHALGDYLVVIMLFYFLKSFFNFKWLYIGITVLTFSYLIEFLQLIHILEILNLQDSKILRIVFGTTFAITDLIAYTLGICTVFLIEKHLESQSTHQIF